MRFGNCRGCGERIVWIKTPAGKSMPCNIRPVLYRARAGAPGKIVTPNGEVVSCDVNVFPEIATGLGYVSHFVTCPQAEKFRRRNADHDE